MANYNRVLLMGNLTRDPQLSYTPNNTAVVEFGIAVNRKWRGQDGSDREETMFVDCTLFGRGAEVFNQYMSKGRPVFLEGRLKLDRWETSDGQKRSKHTVVVENFQFLGGGGQGGGQGGGPRQGYANQGGGRAPQQQQRGDEQPSPSYDDGPPPPSDEDIPF